MRGLGFGLIKDQTYSDSTKGRSVTVMGEKYKVYQCRESKLNSKVATELYR